MGQIRVSVREWNLGSKELADRRKQKKIEVQDLASLVVEQIPRRTEKKLSRSESCI